MPVTVIAIPVIFFKLIFSLNTISENITINMGDEIAIRDRLIAPVVFPARYMSVLKTVTPKNAVMIIYLKFFFIISYSLMLFFKAIGASTIAATSHL